MVKTIHEYVQVGDEAEVKRWLQRCPDVDEVDDQGQTPLHVAAFENQLNIIKLLLRKGADCNALDSKSWTPLHCAASAWNFKACQLLLQTGKANVNVETPSGSTVLNYLCRTQNCDTNEQVKTLKMVLEAGAEVDAKNQFGETALHQACLRGSPESVGVLIQAGADINKANT